MAMHEPSIKLWTDARTLAVAREIDERFPRKDWTSTYQGHGDDGAAFAIDFMCGKAVGDRIADYAWKNRARLGVWYVIWNGRIISITKGRSYWRTYYPTARAIANNPDSAYHRNHVHVSRHPGAPFTPLEPVKPLKPGERRVPLERIIYLDKLTPGVRDSDSVYHLQTLLNKVNGPNVLRSGDYDAATVESVKAFQTAMHDDVIDGDIGPLGLDALIERAGRGYQNYTIEKES